MSPPPRNYFLVDEPIPGHRIFDLLGRVVYVEGDSLKHPTTGSILPHLPPDGPDLRELVLDLYPEHVKACSAEALRKMAHDESARANISKALGVFYSRARSGQAKLSIPSFRRITMEEQHRKIESLLSKEKYNKEIIEFFEKYPHSKLGVIVSIISGFEMRVENDHSQMGEGGGNVTLSTDGIADLALEAKARRDNTVLLSGTYEDEVIIACGYLQMHLKEQPNGWKFWRSHRPSPHDIKVTYGEEIQPLTMEVFVPPTRIEGDMEGILGGITECSGEDAKAAPAAGAAISDLLDVDEDDEGDEFVLYA